MSGVDFVDNMVRRGGFHNSTPQNGTETDPASASPFLSKERIEQAGAKAEHDVIVGRDFNSVNTIQKNLSCAIGGTLVFLIGLLLAPILFLFVPPVGKWACERYLVVDDADVYCQNPGTTMLKSSHPVKTICGALNSDVDFIGREKELADISKRFQDSDYVILEGPHGVGTTALALQYSKTNKFSSVICIDARTEANAEKQFRTVAKFLKTSAEDENEPLFPDGIKEVHDLLECHPTLMIFDGVEEFYQHSRNNINEYYPYRHSNMSAAAKHQIKTIVTAHGWNHFPTVPPPFKQDDIIRVEAFNMADCEQYALTKLSSDVPDRETNWKNLAEYYSCLPLSMRIATHYINVKAADFEYSIEMFLYEVTHSKMDLKSASGFAPVNDAKISDLVDKSVKQVVESAGNNSKYIIDITAFAPSQGITNETLYKITQLLPGLKMSEKEFRRIVRAVVQRRVFYSRIEEDGQLYISMDRIYQEEILKSYDLEFVVETFFTVFNNTDDKDVLKAIEDSLANVEPMIKQNLEREDLIQLLCQYVNDPFMELFRSCKILRKIYQSLAYPSGNYYNTEESRRASKLLVKCYKKASRTEEALHHLQKEYDALKNSRDLSLTLTDYADEVREEMAQVHRMRLEPFQGYKMLESHYYDCRHNLKLGHSETLRAAKDVIEYLLQVGLERRNKTVTRPPSPLLSQFPADVEISVVALAGNLRELYQELRKHFATIDDRAVEILSTFIPPLTFKKTTGLEEAKTLYAKVISSEDFSWNFKVSTLRNFVGTLLLAGHNDEAVLLLHEAIDPTKNSWPHVNQTLAFMDQLLCREEVICLLYDVIERTDANKQDTALEQFKLALYRQLELAGVPPKQRTADFLRTKKLCKNFKATGVSLKSLIAESNQATRGLPGMFTIVGAAVGLIWQLSL